MEKSVLLVCLGILLIAQTGTTLRCFQCRSHKQSDCIGNGPLARVTECPRPSYNMAEFCIYKELYDTQLQAPTYMSSCGTQQQPTSSNYQSAIQQQQCQPSGREQIRDCKICMSDLCNTGSNTPQYDSNPNHQSNLYPNLPNQQSNTYRPGDHNNPRDPYYRPSSQNTDVYRSGDYNSNTYRSGDYNSEPYRSGDYNSDTYRPSNTYDSNTYRPNNPNQNYRY